MNNPLKAVYFSPPPHINAPWNACNFLQAYLQTDILFTIKLSLKRRGVSISEKAICNKKLGAIINSSHTTNTNSFIQIHFWMNRHFPMLHLTILCS